ncbi:hypothetical protein BSL78_06969 [Apostichopus japonicus]|uniref:Immunoglobulin I-set domain-containing protein n=1 Tax=Stichopus japonicus TaxID=307972 RepID=A0A2G8L738_STIJA|nr:hypothetical protein BSL78_06969 [Apostichopus japonicus]
MEPSDIVPIYFNWNNSWSDYRSDAERNWKGSPKITQAPRDDGFDEVYEEDDWKWTMRIKGRRPITIRLYKDNQVIKEQAYDTDMTMFQCTIKWVTLDDEGEYKLKISNMYGTVTTYRTLYVL